MSRLRCPVLATFLALCLLLSGALAAAAQAPAAGTTGGAARPEAADAVPAASSGPPPTPEAAEPDDGGERAPEAAEPEGIDADAGDAPGEDDLDGAPDESDVEAVPADAPPGDAVATDAATGDSDSATSTAPGAAAPAMTRGPKKQVYGWIEDVLIDPKHALKLPAKLDTGADTTSLDARNIRRSRRDGEDYVRFVVTEPASGQSVELEKPFVRAVRIRAHGNEARRRVVVRMRICIGDRSRSVEVNLVDRGSFEYPLLLGRNALRDVAVIDPNLRRTREPSCWNAADSLAATPPSDTTESAGGETPTCESAPMC